MHHSIPFPRAGRRLAVLGGALAALAAIPAAADAATVELLDASKTLRYGAVAGERNTPSIRLIGSETWVSDIVPLTPGQMCESLTAKTVKCSLVATRVSVLLGDRDDAAFVDLPASGSVYGGRGNDRFAGGGAGALGGSQIDYFGGDDSDAIAYPVSEPLRVSLDDVANDGRYGRDQDNVHADVEHLTGGGGDDVLSGDDDANQIDGGAGDDELSGRGGDDTFAQGNAANGADTVRGGEGTDTVSYEQRWRPVKVFLDGSGNDGEAGEHDNILDAQRVWGGTGDDWLSGDSVHAVGEGLSGGPGVDTLIGWGGDDFLSGGTGAGDRLFGDGGDDSLATRDGNYEQDFATCGGGIDTVYADDGDTPANDCETIDGA